MNNKQIAIIIVIVVILAVAICVSMNSHILRLEAYLPANETEDGDVLITVNNNNTYINVGRIDGNGNVLGSHNAVESKKL